MTFKEIQIGEEFKFRGVIHKKLGKTKQKHRKGTWIFNAVDTTAKRQPRRYFIDEQGVEK